MSASARSPTQQQRWPPSGLDRRLQRGPSPQPARMPLTDGVHPSHGPTRRVSGLTGATPQAFLTAAAINLKRLAAALFATPLTCRLFVQPLAVPRRRVPIRRPRQVANISNRGRPLQPLHPSEASATAPPGCIGCATRSRMCRRTSTRWSRPRSARPSCKPTRRPPGRLGGSSPTSSAHAGPGLPASLRGLLTASAWRIG